MQNSTLVHFLRSNTGGFDDNGTKRASKKTEYCISFLLTMLTTLENMAFRSPRGDYYKFTTLFFGKF